jgi:hypothetical protein
MKASTPLPKKAKSIPGSRVPVVEVTAVDSGEKPTSTSRAVNLIQSSKGDSVMVQHVEAEQHYGTPVLNGVKAVGEVCVIPGASMILDGNVKGAAVHIAGAYVARAVIGPVGWVYFAADSFSKSVTGKSLYQYFIPSKN